MKKTYQNPVLNVNLIEHIDLITTSDPYQNDILWDLKSIDSE